jgi:outer membrane protein assembly factor BamE
MLKSLLLSVLIACLLCACQTVSSPLAVLPSPRDLPFIHKIDVQQGNVVTQDMVGQLRKGMDKKKVQFIMGTPVILDTFNAERWDYVYTFQPGGGDTERRRVTLVFKDEKLDRIDGNVVPAAGKLKVARHRDTTVDVPKEYRKGFIRRVAEKMPFTDDDKDAKDKQNAGKNADGKDKKSDDDKRTAKTDKSKDAVSAPDDEEATADDDPVDVPEDPHVAKAEPQPLSNPYDNIQAAPGEGIVVPPDAPRHSKRKGFLTRLVDGIGLGAEDDDREENKAGPEKPGFRDVSNPDD